MERRVSVFVTVVAVVVASATTAVAVSVADDDNVSGHRDEMMSSRGHDVMPAMMHETRVGSEYAYLAEMVAHHEEAIAVGEQLQRSERAEMREFGEAIIASQSAQVDQMQGWLAAWYPDRPDAADYQPMMRDLTDLSGDRLDRVFLQDMIRHHMGAVMMSQQLVMSGVAEHEQVEALAETIRDEQHAEILQMQQWLQEWFGAAWQHGMGGGMHGMGGGMHGMGGGMHGMGG